MGNKHSSARRRDRDGGTPKAGSPQGSSSRAQEKAPGSSLGSLATPGARIGVLQRADAAAPREREEAVSKEARAVQRDAAGGGDEARPEALAGKVSK